MQESDELYLLSRDGADTVKVRDGLMDVKHLERVDDQGLEQWMPTMKSAFPLGAADIRSVWAALGVIAPPLERSAYTLEQFLSELVHPERRVARRRGAQAPPQLRARRLHGGADRGGHGPDTDADDRGRV